MIVTRQRRKPFPWARVLYPLGLALIVAAALSWQPSRDWLLQGPLAGVYRPLSAPFDALAQQRVNADQVSQIAGLQKQIVAAQAQNLALNKHLSALQTQLSAAQQEAAMAGGQRQAPAHAVAPAAAPVTAVDSATNATPEMRRTASEWAAMDPQAAAKVVQRLSVPYVARVFAVMPADAVGAILENVPPALAAQLTQEHPELRR